MCIERHSSENPLLGVGARPRPMLSTTTRTRTSNQVHRWWRYFGNLGNSDANELPSSTAESLLRPAVSAGVVRPSAAVLFRQLVGAVCLLAICWLWVPRALAHEIGLSVVELRLERERLSAQLTFAQSEVEELIAAGKKGTGDGNPAGARTSLEALAPAALEVTLDGRPLQSSRVVVQAEPNNTIQFRLDFPMAAGSLLGLRSTLPARLTAGHRQFVVLRSRSGQILAERILDGNNNGFEADLAGLGASEAKPESFRQFLALGVEHILTGYDHVVFLLGLLLAGSAFWSTAKIITSFTLAHSITLALAVLDVVRISPGVVEPLIAASIVYVGLENIFQRDLRWRWLLTFVFGLVHGFGFASVLRELGIGAAGAGVAVPLISFNLGVEIGQIGIMLLVLPLIWKLRSRPFFVMRCVPTCSLLVTLAGGYWLVRRTLLS
ncbi:MAG: HupE/UreJ family protein [Acidobacteria bacterium]|nr:HupE/UreJ family protein [Acidobacteriota bacterium]